MIKVEEHRIGIRVVARHQAGHLVLAQHHGQHQGGQIANVFYFDLHAHRVPGLSVGPAGVGEGLAGAERFVGEANRFGAFGFVLGDELAGLLGIMAQGFRRRDIPGRILGEHAPGVGVVTVASQRLAQGVQVESQQHGSTHPDIVEGGPGGVEVKDGLAGHRRLHDLQRCPSVLCGGFGLGHGVGEKGGDELHIAGLEGGQPGVLIGQEAEGDPLEPNRPAPIARVANHAEMVVRNPFFKCVGPRSRPQGGPAEIRPGGGDGCGGQHHALVAGQHRGQGRPWGVQAQAHGARVHHGDLLQGRKGGPVELGGALAIQVGLDRGGVERGAVMELHAVAHDQGPAQPVGRFGQRLGQVGLGGGAQRCPHKGVVEGVANAPGADGQKVPGGIQTRRLGVQTHAQDAGACSAPFGSAVGSTAGGGQHQDQEDHRDLDQPDRVRSRSVVPAHGLTLDRGLTRTDPDTARGPVRGRWRGPLQAGAAVIRR